MTGIPYARARGRIETGDLIAVRGQHTPLAWATRLLLQTPYTHTGLAIRIEGRLLIAEMEPIGNVLSPLSRYRDTPFDVFDCPVDRVKVRAQIMQDIGEDIDYDWGDLARIAWSRVSGLPRGAEGDGALICSAASARAWLAHGWAPATPLPAIAAPSDVVAALDGRPKLEVRPVGAAE
jgi:hypothetical protein